MADHYQDGYGGMPGDYGGYGPAPGGYGMPPDNHGRAPSGYAVYPDNYGPDPGGYGAPPDPGGYSAHPDSYAPQGEPYDFDPTYDPRGGVGYPDLNDRSPEMHDNALPNVHQSWDRCAWGIDPENGIAPRRCTDCVCLGIFLVYVVGMVILVTVARTSSIGNRPWGDIRRLTHGHDFRGRLCGVDTGVEDRAFTFWCRDKAQEWGPNPSGLNLEYPVCVHECPYNSTEMIGCLFKQAVQQATIHGGVFGTVETYHVQFQQSIAQTHAYDSVAFGGRFCVPANVTMKAVVLHGPLKYSRLFYSVGSLQDCWFVIFQATLLAVLLGYVFLFLIRLLPKFFVLVFLYLTWALLSLATFFFLYAVLGLVATKTGNAALMEKARFAEYMEFNPLYARYMQGTATLLSVTAAAGLLLMGCGVLGIITHVAGDFGYVPDLVDASSECWFQDMRSMLAPPAVEAIAKFVLTWILAYNFMFLVSVGWYEERRLVVNEKLYKDESAVYHFDARIMPWIAYYLFGWVWIIELTTSCGQFVVSFCVISWYFLRRKTGIPPMPVLHGVTDCVCYHMGSLCLGAAIIPWVRLLRIFNWIEDESVPNEEAACCDEGIAPLTVAINGCCRCIGGMCKKLTDQRKQCQPACCNTEPPATHLDKDKLINAGCTYRYMKNAYMDVIIRSQHFLQASQRSFLLIHRYGATKTYMLEGRGCQVVTSVGVVTIGCMCMVYTYWVIMCIGSFTDPKSQSFIAEPMGISVMAFFLCGSIGYSFMSLFDHGADTLLYCYAWNKKFSKDSNGLPIDAYLPDSLRELIDTEIDDDDAYRFYGQARPEMYLGTWLPKKRPLPRLQAQATSSGTGQPAYYDQASGSSGAGYAGYSSHG